MRREVDGGESREQSAEPGENMVSVRMDGRRSRFSNVEEAKRMVAARLAARK